MRPTEGYLFLLVTLLRAVYAALILGAVVVNAQAVKIALSQKSNNDYDWTVEAAIEPLAFAPLQGQRVAGLSCWSRACPQYLAMPRPLYVH